jgi:hypothetical protein
MSTPDHELWEQAGQLLLRAERLLAHSVEGLREGERRRRRDRDRLALEVEQLLTPLEALSSGLARVIEELAQDRQDNRLQRWQGQLQQLLTPLDSGTQSLKDLLVQLDQPLRHELEAVPGGMREVRRQEQLQQLLLLRQKQVLQLQSEVSALQAELFSRESGPAPGAGDEPAPADGGAFQGSTPSIFS